MSETEIISNDPLIFGVAIAMMIAAILIFTRNKNVAITIGVAGITTLSPVIGIAIAAILSIIGLFMWNRPLIFYSILGIGLWFVVLFITEFITLLTTGTISY